MYYMGYKYHMELSIWILPVKIYCSQHELLSVDADHEFFHLKYNIM